MNQRDAHKADIAIYDGEAQGIAVIPGGAAEQELSDEDVGRITGQGHQRAGSQFPQESGGGLHLKTLDDNTGVDDIEKQKGHLRQTVTVELAQLAQQEAHLPS